MQNLRNRLALLSLALCLGVSSVWAAPITAFKTREPELLRDPVLRNDHLPAILSGLQWFAEQEALRSRILFPPDLIEADVPIGPHRPPQGAQGL